MSTATLKVAVTQAEPVYLDLAGTLEKTLKLVDEAAQNGARIIAFPEVWMSGYPGWIWQRPVDPVMNTQYQLNSLSLDSREMTSIKSAAKRNSIAIILGFSERTPTHSLYISQGIISPQGDLALHRRKIKPTHMERTVFGDGSGSDLNNVAELDFGGEVGKVRVGTLACWEHLQPLLKYNTYAQREEIHISMWPPIDPHGGVTSPGLYSMSAEGVMNLSQTYAMESGAYVLHCTGVCNEKGMETMKTKGGLLFQAPGGGHSAAIGPDGRRLTAPLEEGNPAAEGIVYAELDLSRIITNRGFLDVVGHYSRPDLLWLGADKAQKEFVVQRRGGQDEDVAEGKQ
ncbi:carbon-nitrogen hydrolase [Sarocladium strictum]